MSLFPLEYRDEYLIGAFIMKAQQLQTGSTIDLRLVCQTDHHAAASAIQRGQTGSDGISHFHVGIQVANDPHRQVSDRRRNGITVGTGYYDHVMTPRCHDRLQAMDDRRSTTERQ
jgi:hypothetical protein